MEACYPIKETFKKLITKSTEVNRNNLWQTEKFKALLSLMEEKVSSNMPPTYHNICQKRLLATKASTFFCSCTKNN